MYTNTSDGTAAHAAPSTGTASDESVAVVTRAPARTTLTAPATASTSSSGMVALTLDV